MRDEFYHLGENGSTSFLKTKTNFPRLFEMSLIDTTYMCIRPGTNISREADERCTTRKQCRHNRPMDERILHESVQLCREEKKYRTRCTDGI